MNRLGFALGQAISSLRDEGFEFALVGGLAVSARSEPRFTRDADLAVAVGSDEEAEGLVARLSGRGYRVTAQVEHTHTGRLATVRLTPPGEPSPGLVVDLRFASSGIEPEVIRDTEELRLSPTLVVPVASTW